MSDLWHRSLAILGTILAIALPIVGHSVFAASQADQMIITMIAGVLATAGFTAVKPLAPQLLPWTAAHRWVAGIGVLLAAVVPAARAVYGGAHPAVALACDIALPVLASAGFVAVHSVNAIPASAAVLALMSAFFAMPGCATPGAQALGACEIGQLAPAEQAAVATVEEIALNTGSTVGDLEQLGASLLPGQVACAVKAVLAWINARKLPATPMQRMLAAVSETLRGHAVGVLEAYLKLHPATACRPIVVTRCERPTS